jgi:hypothetical protein
LRELAIRRSASEGPYGDLWQTQKLVFLQLSYGGPEHRLAGSDRKTTGSNYTPDQLVQLLIVSALLPVIKDRLETASRLSKATTPQEKQQELEAALLAIRVLDPACGSGHFLLAAARRLALELARLRAGDEEPSEELRQECLREVVGRCIYGVDKNPMAVELCKMVLWIEAVDPGKPLSFLDAHIQCGDSLVGVFDPKVLEQGIPDEAYKALTGDEKPPALAWRRRTPASARRAKREPFRARSISRALHRSTAASNGSRRSRRCLKPPWPKDQPNRRPMKPGNRSDPPIPRPSRLISTPRLSSCPSPRTATPRYPPPSTYCCCRAARRSQAIWSWRWNRPPETSFLPLAPALWRGDGKGSL